MRNAKMFIKKNHQHWYPTNSIKSLYVLIKLKAITLALNILTSKYAILAESKSKRKNSRNLQNDVIRVTIMDD